MEEVMKSMMKLQRITKWINIGTIVEAILLLFNAILWFLPPYLITIVPSLYGESIFTISYMLVYGILILLLYIYNKMIKDIQKGITLTVLRALISVILPIPLLFPLATLFGFVWFLALIFFILCLLRFLLMLPVVRKLQALQKKFST